MTIPLAPFRSDDMSLDEFLRPCVVRELMQEEREAGQVNEITRAIDRLDERADERETFRAWYEARGLNPAELVFAATAAAGQFRNFDDVSLGVIYGFTVGWEAHAERMES